MIALKTPLPVGISPEGEKLLSQAFAVVLGSSTIVWIRIYWIYWITGFAGFKCIEGGRWVEINHQNNI